MHIIIFGATGLVGNLLLQYCLDSNKVSKLSIFVRKNIDVQHPKLTQHICDANTVENVKEFIQADVVFNCLGTTLKVAGSKEAQYAIDCTYPIKVANIAATNGVKTMVNISSVGASSTGNFYLKTKDAMEQGVINAIGRKGAYFVRPSFLTGLRKELRLGEKIGIWSFKLINPLLIGSAKKYKSINATIVAKAMLQIALSKPEQTVFYYTDMVALAKY
jgi:dTDP-4-dehydrorhamnose reductase